jgi:hypothetical protein
MNLRCGFCQTPYAIGRTEILAALQHLEGENLTHYDAHCPRCRRATPVLRQKLEMALPNWKEELKQAVNQPEAGAQTVTPAAPKPAAPAKEEPKAQPAAKKAAAKSPAKPADKPAKTPVPKKTQATKAGTSKTAAPAPARKKGK